MPVANLVPRVSHDHPRERGWPVATANCKDGTNVKRELLVCRLIDPEVP